MGTFKGNFNFGRRYNHSSPVTFNNRSWRHNRIHSSPSRNSGGKSWTVTPIIVLLIVINVICGVVAIVVVISWYCFRRKNIQFIKKLKSTEISNITTDYIDKNAQSSMTILYSCLVNGENCLLILPLREHGNKLFENDIKINEKLRNRIYFRKLFIDVMLSYSKEQNVLHYIPYNNLKRKKLFFSSYLKKMDLHRRDNSKYLLHSAIEFTNCVFQPSFFTKDSEFIMFCILHKSYIDIEIYQCTDEELVLNFYGSFYFKDELAIEYFSYTMDSLAEKVDASQIDEMIGNVIANGEKISMSLNSERNSYCIAIPPLQH